MPFSPSLRGCFYRPAGLAAALLFSGVLTGSACAPQTGSIPDGGLEDLGSTSRDLQESCVLVNGNLLSNPSFEDTGGAATPSARNTGMPASTIVGGWEGCCSQANGSTEWKITTTTAFCGQRGLDIQSTTAMENVLFSPLTRTGDVGRTFLLKGYAFVSAASAGGSLKLDVFDLMTSKPVAATTALVATTSNWQELSVSGTIPTGGRIQVRATVDDGGGGFWEPRPVDRRGRLRLPGESADGDPEPDG